MSRKINSILLTIPLLALPATAWAVNTSANDGNGSQTVKTWYSNGATLTGNLRSTSGKSVYHSARLVYDWESDYTAGRYSSNVTSRSLVTNGGTASALLKPGVDGVNARVCTDLSGLPDPCGSWSSQISR